MVSWSLLGRRAATLLLVSGGLLWASALPAHAATSVSEYTVAGSIRADGSLAVTATITFAGSAPDQLQQVFAATTRTTEDTEYHYQISDVSLASGSTVLAPTVTQSADSVTVDMPTAGISEPVKLSYVVRGAAITGPQNETILRWALLQGLSLPVASFDATIEVPAQFDQLDCAAGNAVEPASCTYYGGGTHDTPLPVFHDEDRAAGEVVVITVGFPEGLVASNQDLRDIWTLDRAFSVSPLPLAVAAGLLLFGGLGLWLAHRRIGRDRGAELPPRPVAEFSPVGPGKSEFRVLDGIRPGEIGTLADERVDPVDVTATVLDLAIRGHLLIEELPRESAHAATDWSFVRRPSEDPLLAYERTLLDAIAPVDGSPARVSGLSVAVRAVIATVQSELYDEVVERGWFAHRPDATRNRWALLGWVLLGISVVATLVLAAFTHFGLVGLALIALAVGLIAVAKEMPARTAAGTAILRGLEVLRGSLLTHPVENLLPGDAHRQLSQVVAYTVVLGGRERWLQAMADADDDGGLPDSTDLDWYHAPVNWHFADLPASLHNFITVVQGTLFSR